MHPGIFLSIEHSILQRELVLKAKEVFVTYGPWLVQGALDKLKVSLVFNFKNNNIICF